MSSLFCVGAGETGGGADRVDSAAFTTVYDPTARNRHVQPECEFVAVLALFCGIILASVVILCPVFVLFL